MSPQRETGTGHSLARLREAIRDGRRDVRMLVPTATLAEHRRHQLAREGLVFRPDVVQTLSRFVADMVPAVKQVSEPLFQLIVERSLREVDALEFSPVSDAPGFPKAVSRAIGRLDAVGLTARELGRGCEAWQYAGPLARVWERIEERLRARGLALRAGILRAAASMVQVSVAQVKDELLLNGFAKFSAPERDLLQKLGVQPEESLAEFPATCRCDKFVAESEVREAEEIARRILQAAERGIPFREMGIALRNQERYLPVFRAVLERFGIPARFYFSEPLSANAAVQFFSGTVDAFLSGWDHEKCLPVLRLAPRFSPDALDQFDFAVREKIPDSGLAALLELPGKEKPLTDLIHDWETLETNWQRRATPLRWAEQLVRDLRNTLRPLPIPDAQSASTMEWERAQAAAVDLFESALLETAADWPPEHVPISLAQFWERAKTVLQHTALRPHDRRRNVVHVMSVYESRQWNLDVVFICGLAEKAFPKRHQEDAFLPDEAMRKLQRAGYGVDTSVDLDREEQHLFQMVSQSARQQLVLSYATEQKNGPSVFWLAAPGTEEEPQPVRPAIRQRPAARRTVTRIADPELIAWTATARPAFSVTGLENYLGCPFKFFSLNLLGLRSAPLRPEKRLNFLEQGNLVHKVLEEWLLERPAIRPMFDRVFNQHCAQLRVARGFRTETAYASMLADVERFAGESTNWPRHEACAVEKKMTFQIADDITINARVDRLERLPDGRLVIIDYKYSNAKNTKDKSEDETRLQGPLYVRGIAQGGEVVAAMVYFSLKKSAEVFGWGVVPGLGKELQELTPEWVDQGTAEARRAVEHIREGRIPVLREPGPACKWCEAKDACRVGIAGAAMTAGGAN